MDVKSKKYPPTGETVYKFIYVSEVISVTDFFVCFLLGHQSQRTQLFGEKHRKLQSFSAFNSETCRADCTLDKPEVKVVKKKAKRDAKLSNNQ